MRSPTDTGGKYIYFSSKLRGTLCKLRLAYGEDGAEGATSQNLKAKTDSSPQVF